MTKIDITNVKESFINDTKNHTMLVKHDVGIYRHLSFSDNGSSNHLFEITTWPGSLCISGDMGCFVFSRIPDMFNFFGDEFESDYGIKPSYWSEKLEAVSGRSDAGYEKYCPELFNENIKSDFTNWVTENDLDPTHEAVVELWAAIEDEVLLWAAENEVRAVDAATSFEYDCGDLGKFTFEDFWEHNNRQYTYRFIWALYAIVWGIREYNKCQP